MRSAIAIFFFMAAGRAAAGEVEAAVRVGQVVPFYSQSFHFDPGPFLSSTFPGIAVEPIQDLRLEGHGGLAIGGGLTWFVAGGLGFEGRIDTADVTVTSTDAVVNVRLPLPAPLPTLSSDVRIPATADLERLRVLSLNLAARTPGRIRLRLSGGVSYLPSLRFSVSSSIQAEGRLLSALPLAQVVLRAEAEPGAEGESRLGFNAGGGLALPLASRVSLDVEARYFRFQRQTLAWAVDPGVTLPPFEQQIAHDLLSTLGPVSFNPEFFQATAGISIGF
jgi:opacity protein-like surface antigen